ncbi:TetR/AcrR family transcriptional regulator [Conexibacter woesei]|uniref:TetR/AcrR family transcriptional regulator n=1 Tax=Conexibacter woesei TaxID=191495 RepID=UPI00041EB7DA|nr:TetR/AcrR family transcriptional regulator [Conexibacter woesei]
MSAGEATPRRRDAAATRDALLVAARELFDANGFRGTTVRMIGERAGVDQALIARYFGGKSELYQAVLADAGAQPEVAADDGPPPRERTPREVIDLFLARVDEHGVGPVLRALMAPETDAETLDAVTARLRERVIVPLTRSLKAAGVDDPKLRAELIVAQLLGVMTARANGSLPLVSAADRDALADLLERMLCA